jgi:hypothetical protein
MADWSVIGIYLEGLTKVTEVLNSSRRFLGWDLDLEPSDYEAGVPTIRLLCR